MTFIKGVIKVYGCVCVFVSILKNNGMAVILCNNINRRFNLTVTEGVFGASVNSYISLII